MAKAAMSKDPQKILKKLLAGKATKEEIELLRQMNASREISIRGDVNHSVIVIGDGNRMDLTPDLLEVLQKTLPEILKESLSPKISLPSADAFKDHRAALREKTLARWGETSVYISQEGATLPIEASPYGTLGRSENLLETIRTTNRLIVLGEPGSGKSVALERMAWELCGDDQAPIPVLMPLRSYAEVPLKDWIWSMLRRTGCLMLGETQQVDAFLDESQCRFHFLFDGLNEVAPAYRDRLVEQLQIWMNAHPHHQVIISSRAQDELWRTLRGDVERVQVVQNIRDEQAQEYLEKHLGEKKGRALYHGLAPKLREMARTPLLLWMIKKIGDNLDVEKADELPVNRGQLFEQFVNDILKWNPQPKYRDIPDGMKKDALKMLAGYLGSGQKVSCKREEAVEALRGVNDIQAERMIEVCLSHGLLAGEDEIWFAPHQTIQEYFAARALSEQVEREHKLDFSLTWHKRILRDLQRWRGIEEGLAVLANDPWWMETFVQLAGLTTEKDSNWFALEVARVNPWLAWWCVEEGRGMSDKTRQQVTERSQKLLTSNNVEDRRRAVQTLAQVYNKRVPEHLFHAAGDENTEVAALAVQSLVKWGEIVSPLVADALRGEDQRAWRAALNYLAAQPNDPLCQNIPWEKILGQPMVWIPPGPFLMGSDKSKDAKAKDDELPQHEVTLSGYWIGRFQVTVANWRAFAQASGRYVDKKSLEDPDTHPVQYVSWDDAAAYCRWISEKTGLSVSLPTEAQWEKAARSTDGRIYPWGDEFDKDKCNTREFGIKTTTPEGKYSPQGDSPYGCADMAGNLWDWCLDWYDREEYKGRTGKEVKDPCRLEGGTYRVVRGGSWYLDQDLARASSRSHDIPRRGGYSFGFRLVVHPPSL